MISDERLQWIGIGIVVVAVTAFVSGIVKVLRGRARKSILFEETVQDVALVCLGVSLLFKRGEMGRVVLMAAFVVLFGSFVAKRICVWRGRETSEKER